MAATGENPNNWNLGAAPESSALKHKSGISLDWTLEEQAILEDGLAKWVKNWVSKFLIDIYFQMLLFNETSSTLTPFSFL